MSFRMTANGLFGERVVSERARFITLSARPLTPRKKSPGAREANCLSTVGMDAFGNATLTATIRSRLGDDYRKKSFAFLVVEVSQPLLYRGDEAGIVGLACQVACFLEILTRFVY